MIILERQQQVSKQTRHSSVVWPNHLSKQYHKVLKVTINNPFSWWSAKTC